MCWDSLHHVLGLTAHRMACAMQRTFQKEQRHMQRSADARNRFTHITQRAQEAAQQDVEFRCSRIESDVSLLGEFSRQVDAARAVG